MAKFISKSVTTNPPGAKKHAETLSSRLPFPESRMIKTSTTMALAAIIATAASSMAFAQQPMAQRQAQAAPAMERCYGVARAGHNDCAAGAHSCAGQATRDNDPASFVEVPAGVCAKLAHGSPTAPSH